MKHVLSIAELGSRNLSDLVNQGVAMANANGRLRRLLENKVVGIFFRGTSTRTRTSFTVAALRLGAQTIHYGPQDLQLVTGESIEDTARVLSGFIDILVVRTNGDFAEMKAFASQDDMAVVNAMSENEHPTQAITDLITLKEAFGHLDGLHVLYIGEGNNSAASLALAVALTPGMRLTIITPEGYGLQQDILETSQRLAAQHAAAVYQHHEIDLLPSDVDAVYTTRWQTMGVPKADSDWLTKFAPYQITPEIMARASKSSRTIFLHDLPAIRGQEVVNEVLDGPQSVAFRQAQHKLTGALSVLAWSTTTD
jgi:ornithine carbamoyltransferase